MIYVSTLIPIFACNILAPYNLVQGLMDITNIVIQTLFWSLGFVFLFKIPGCKSNMSETSSYPSVSIVIPARNEEKTLPILLASLKNQRFTADEVIVIDDNSEDKTRQVAVNEGARVIQSKPLPEKWTGKPWACYQGAKVAKGEILIFMDADTSIEKDGLKRIMDTYMKKDGVISIQPYHKTRKLYEQFSAFFNVIVMGAMGPFTMLGNLVKPIGLFGPCIVMKREYYFKIGGHRDVKSEVIEDIALGARFRKQKIATYCYGGKGTISFRMYPNGIGELLSGWSKGFTMGAVKTPLPLLLAIIAWIGGSIGTTRYLIQAMFNMDAILILLWTSLYLGYVVQIYWMMFRVGTFKFYTALFYPIPLLFYLAVFSRSLVSTLFKRSVKWKGRTITLKDRAPTE